MFLESDLSFSEGSTFDHIGNTIHNYFRGAFDGQGHVISNLAVTSDSPYIGLFGFFHVD